MNKTNYTACPKCEAVFVKEEVQAQECWTCGWTAADNAFLNLVKMIGIILVIFQF